MTNNDEKIRYIFKLKNNVLYHLRNFEIKIQLIRGETKITNLVKG